MSGRSHDKGVKGDEIPLQGHRVKTKCGSSLYIHRVALLPLDLRTVSERSEETSKCALIIDRLSGIVVEFDL